MLFKDLFLEENKELTECYALTIEDDDDVESAPEKLEIAGFLYKKDDEGLIHEKLLDVIISYRLTKVNVILEVPSNLLVDGSLTAKYLMQLANNVDFALSILPPGHPEVSADMTQEQYNTVVEGFLDEMLQKPNFEKLIFPITSFFDYIMLEQLLGKEHEAVAQFKPSDDYVVENFVKIMTVAQSDAFKDVIRQKLYIHYGGQEEFAKIAQLIFSKIKDKTKEFYTQEVKNYLQSQNPQATDSPESDKSI